jgi:molecular chaperone HscB
MDNYFDFYKIEELFYIDEANLKQLYLRFSKQYHPDFFADNEQEYDKALHISSQNNIAFKKLKKFESRVHHILELSKVLKPSENSLPSSFLMEMMDINEAVMELKMQPSESESDKLNNEVDTMHIALSNELEELTKQADSCTDSSNRNELLLAIKDIYLKMKYVLRIKESLNTFAQL